MILLLTGASPAPAQQADDVPGVSLDPAGTDGRDPNEGQWFIAEGEPGSTVTLRARIENLADVEQRIELYLVAMEVGDDDRAVVGGRDEGVGSWGRFDEPSIVLGPRSQVEAPFTVTVPRDAEPGDHVGAVVAEAAPQGNGSSIAVQKRSASRLYITVPGDASPAIEIESVEVDVHRPLLARTAAVEVTVRNTGNVRLETTVLVGDEEARGSELVMSKSTERYVVTKPVPLWGGPVTWPVDVATRTSVGRGPTASAKASRLVVPGWILLAIFLLVLGWFSVRELRRRLG